MATYLIAKAGAEGLSRQKLLTLLYLVERGQLSARKCTLSGDEFMLTAFGPVLKRAARILESPAEGGKFWERRLEWVAAEQPAAMVAEPGEAYNSSMPADTVRLKLREPQPPPRWEDHGQEFLEMCGEIEEGIPFLGKLSGRDMQVLRAAWDQYGVLDEDELRRHALALPEVAGRTEGDLACEAVLHALGYDAREAEQMLAAEEEIRAMNKYESTWRRNPYDIEEDGDAPEEDEE